MAMHINAALPSLRVLPAAWRHMPAICKVEMRCFGGIRLLFGLWQRVGQRGVSTWVAEINGGIAGYLIAYERELDGKKRPYVGGVGTDPAFQRRGIGRELMYAAMTGNDGLWLHVRATNTPAIKLYEAIGMRRHSQLARFYQNGDDAVVMEKGS
jgi:ribosomal protein S18 acetylase RimI-like enzyme